MSEMPPSIQVKVHESASQVIYSDAVIVNGTPLGFVLNFGQWAPEQPGLVRIYWRVGMSPNHLKLLAQILAQNVAGYEARFGEIVVGDTREPPHQHIGLEPLPEKAEGLGAGGQQPGGTSGAPPG
jgi:hypothetical protein